MLKGYDNKTGDDFNVEIDVPYNGELYALSATKVKSAFETWCDNIGQPDYSVKGMFDFVYGAPYVREGRIYPHNKLQCIKLAKMLDKSLGLREAKELIDGLYP